MSLMFNFHLFHLGFLLVSLRSFLLKQRVKTIPENKMLSQGKLHRVARNSSLSRKLTASNLFQNIHFNSSREMRISSREKQDERW